MDGACNCAVVAAIPGCRRAGASQPGGENRLKTGTLKSCCAPIRQSTPFRAAGMPPSTAGRDACRYVTVAAAIPGCR